MYIFLPLLAYFIQFYTIRSHGVPFKSALPFQSCRLCYTCLQQEEREFLKTAYYEHHHKGAFRRVYPPPMVILCDDLVIFNLHL